MANAITTTLASVPLMVNAGSLVDSYSSIAGPYGGSNIGSHGNVVAAGSIINNGVINGQTSPNTPSTLPIPAIPSGAVNLPIGSPSPGSVNINNAAESITLAPGTYVVQNLNVNSPGAINISPEGQVTIFVTGSMNLGGNENLNGSPDNLAFIAMQPGYVNINSNGHLFGSIYAPTSVINVNSQVYGYLAGKSVTLNSGAAVHYDENGACPTFTLTPQPPRTLPAPPTTVGCYGYSEGHWVSIPCTPPSEMDPGFPLPIASEPMIRSNPYVSGGVPTTIPFQFAQVEATFVTVDPVVAENDNLHGNNALSLQLNTNTFPATNGTGDTGWIQFVIQNSPTQGARICLWQVDSTVACQTTDAAGNCTNSAGYPFQCVGGGSNTSGTNQWVVGQRAGNYRAFDFATIGGSTYVDSVTGHNVIGLVAQLSYFDPANDYTTNGNGNGLYATVVDDDLGLHDQWTEVSGTFLGMGGGSRADFTNTAILTRELAGSCATAPGPSPDVPWPGICPTQPLLLPHTSLAAGGGTGESNNLPLVGNPSPTPLVAASPDLVFTEFLMSNSSAIATQTQTVTRTDTNTVTVTETSSATSTGTITQTAVPTATLTSTQVVTGTQTYIATGTVTGTYTGTRWIATRTSSGTVTGTNTASGTETWSGTYVGTGTATGTRTFTDTLTGTTTVTGTFTLTASGRNTATASQTVTHTAIGTGTHTATQTYAVPATETAIGTITTTSSSTHTDTSTVTGTQIGTGYTCNTLASPVFVKTSESDVGVRPINIGSQPFWESPDLFLLPKDSPIDLNAVSSESLVTPGNYYDVWVRVNNDFGCADVDGAMALVYIANPSSLSTQWIAITSTQYMGSTNGTNPNGVTVPAGGRALIGPFTFQAPSEGFGNGHACLMAAIQALPGEPGPANTTDPLSSFQVAQRNIQFSNCVLPITNATLASGNVALTLTTVPGYSPATSLSVTFNDPAQSLFGVWQPGQAAGGYTVSQSGGLTTVAPGQTTVSLAPVSLGAGQTINATAAVTPGTGEPETTLQVQATMTDPVSGNVMVANGLSCVAPAGPPLPGTGGAPGSGGYGGGGQGGSGGVSGGGGYGGGGNGGPDASYQPPQ